ncbi:hypothetical protein DIS24_g1932 [Lasiodiplodia hormozganensis]|uniref:Uncharacterized protein n=3 Tax=Lasiodiplodia TaxID=66739 RepID=A0A5N5DGK0_9PEZI|nr:hypothetical protein DBV05_g4411 [Lasiodiplodia theobromae]KAK0662435.1 hypothetical protein DIS24_g1932 [Lasiodiplodia hormozganensis]
MQVKAALLLSLGMVAGVVTAAPAELPTGTILNNVTSHVLAVAHSSCTIIHPLGWIDVFCDYKTGINWNGPGRKRCRKECVKLNGEVDCRDGSRCIARYGPDMPGQCFCPCGQRVEC